MQDINLLLDELTEEAITNAVGLRHDEARLRYRLTSNVVKTFDEFTRVIADYYNHQFGTCMLANGGSLIPMEAAGRAKELIDRMYRDQGGDIEAAFRDGSLGTNGGMRGILDRIAEGLKGEAVHRYMRDVLDRHITPHEWSDKVDILRQFISHYGRLLGPSIESDKPERYARDCTTLISALVHGMRQASAMFRKL